MLQVGLYFIIIVVMKQACLKCIDCCFEIGDKVFFFFLFFFKCMCKDVFYNMICQTLDWSEFSNISKLRDVFDRHNCTDDTLTDKAHPPSCTGEGD